MKKRKVIVAFLATICILASVCIFGVFAEGTNQVYAEMNISAEQGEYGYCYVYLDDLTDLASLNVAVHYDTEKVTVTDSYNQVACNLYDSSNQNGCLQYSYIFDGEGSNAKTNLFYFCYQVNENAEAGSTYFDIVVTDAYNTAIESVNISGSRCNFTITEKAVAKIVDIYASSDVDTSVKEEFEISYSLGDWQIASGSMLISYDPDLFEFVEITNGEFFDGKIVDVNTNLDGSVYLSFLATEYNYYRTDLLKIKFRTLKNVTETSEIKLTVSELYDLNLNRIVCNGCTTNVGITHDATYTEDSPSVSLSASYNAQTDKITVTIKLDKDSHLGAGDFVLNFDTNYLTYSSVQKGFSPSFFNINNKNVGDGILKFSIISLADITDEQVVLTVVFDVKHACEDKLVALEISGSGLADSLTNPILLNFVDASVTVPLKHTAVTATTENRVEPTCTADGRYDSVVYCSVCDAELSRENKVIDKLGHDYSTEWTTDVDPTCTTVGSKSHHCSRCGDKADISEIPANGHSYGYWYETKAPTCTATGTDEHECSVCHTKETRTTDAKGHTNAVAVVENKVDATCIADGSYDSVIYCSVCKVVVSRETKIDPMLGHDYETKWTTDVDPTCTTVGSKSHHCTRCGDKADITEIPANGHSYGEWYEIQAPTCTVTGTDEHECSVCHKKETRTTDAKGHTNSEAVVENKNAATCTTDGSYDSVIYCSICNTELSREAKTDSMLGHDYSNEWATDVEPTCTTVGSKSHHCTRCDDKSDVTEVPANGHSYLTDFVFDETNHWEECACGEKADSAEHTWDNGVVTKEATVDEEGTKTYTCTYCSHTKTESIPKIVVNIKDTDSGVTLEIPSDSQATLPAGTVIDVVDKSNEQVSDEILDELATTEKTIVEALGVYDLNLLLDGVKIQPNGAVVVTLPAPKLTTEYDRIIVVYIAPDGSYEECKTTVNTNGTISFETDHFSKYAVIGITEEGIDDGLGTGAIIAIIVGALLVMGAGGFAIYWFVIKKNAKATEEIATDKVDASVDEANEEQQ